MNRLHSLSMILINVQAGTEKPRTRATLSGGCAKESTLCTYQYHSAYKADHSLTLTKAPSQISTLDVRRANSHFAELSLLQAAAVSACTP